MGKEPATKLPDDMAEKASIEADTEEHRAKEEQQENLNFFMLLHELDLIERKGTKEELEAIDARVKDKVDGIFSRLTRLQAEEVRLKAIQDEYAKAKAIIANKQERLKDWAKYCMTHFERELLHGHKFSFKISEGIGGCDVKGDRQPTALDYLSHPQYVNRSYSWNKADAIKAIKASATDLPEDLSLGTVRKFLPTIRRIEK